MKRPVITITLILIALAVLLLLLKLFAPEVFDKIWLWIIGFAGLIGAGIKKLGNVFGGKSIKDIDANNEAIKSELSNLRKEIADTDKRLQQERDLHERELAILNAKLEINEKQLNAEKAYRERLRQMSYQEFQNSLSPQEQQNIESEIWKDVKFN